MGGALLNPDANTNCGYCPYSDGTQYLASLNIVPSDKWPYFAIFLVFCISNWALVYFFIYAARVKGWSFGLSYVFSACSVVVSKIKGLFVKKEKKAQ